MYLAAMRAGQDAAPQPPTRHLQLDLHGRGLVDFGTVRDHADCTCIELLNVTDNRLTSFHKLPTMPQLRALLVSYNDFDIGAERTVARAYP